MKILIVNDKTISNETKNHLKEHENSLEFLSLTSASDVFFALEKKKDYSYIIFDTSDKNISWRDLLAKISEKYSKVKPIILSDRKDISDMRYAYNHNAVGFIFKSFSQPQLKSVLEFIIEGGEFFPPVFELMETKKQKMENPMYHTCDCYLTNRQEEVLVNLCRGLSNKQIAHEMNLAEATVKLHVNALLRSLNATNRTHAVITAQKMGIV